MLSLIIAIALIVWLLDQFGVISVIGSGYRTPGNSVGSAPTGNDI